MIRFAVALVALLFAFQAGAADFYACDCQTDADPDCVAGSDAAAGTSAATAKQTQGAALALWNAGGAGDNLWYCEGGAFLNSTSHYTNDCSGGAACTIGMYSASWGTGDERIPIIYGGDNGNDAINLDNLSANASGNLIIQDLFLVGGRVNNAYGIEIVDEWDDVNIRRVRIKGWQDGIFPRHRSAPCGTGDCLPSNIDVTDSEIFDIARQCLGGTWGTGSVISNNYIHDCGGSDPGTPALLDHCLYISGGWGISVINNDIKNCATDPWSVNVGNPDGVCSGSMVNFNGGTGVSWVEDNLVEGNRLSNTNTPSSNCYGISIGGGDTGFEQFRNNIVRGNRVTDVGRIAIRNTSCTTGCVVENNDIAWATRNGTMVGVATALDSTADAETAGVIIRYNSVYAGTGAGDVLRGVQVNTDAAAGGAGFEIYANAFLFEGTGDLECFLIGQVDADITTLDFNACDYDGTGGGLTWIRGSGSIVDRATKAACIANTVFCDSDVDAVFNFEDVTLPDYWLAASSGSSPLVDAGSTTGPTGGVDILGKTRSTNDIGAYEFIATVDRFWVGGTGNWSDNTNHWSATTGGAAGASVPGLDTVAIFDANSGTGTVTLDVAANVRDLSVAAASTIGTLAFGTNTLTCERDCLLEDDAIITAGAGALLVVGRNLDTTAQDLSGLDDFSISLIGPGWWEYSPLAADNPDIDDLTTSQNGWTTTLRQVGAHAFGSSDINIHGQYFSGSGFLVDDLSLETGSNDKSIIEFQTGAEDFRHVSEFTTIGAIGFEHEQLTGDRSVLQTYATYLGTSFDMTGNFLGSPGTGHLWMLYGDLITTGAVSLQKTAEFDQNGYDLVAASWDMSSNNGSGDWTVGTGSATIAGRLRTGDGGVRSLITIGAGGSITAGWLENDGDPANIIGAAGAFLELTTATPACTVEKWVDPDDAVGPFNGTLAEPWNDWVNVEANLSAAGDCVYINRGTSLALAPGDDLEGVGTAGILGAYGTGASPILSLLAAGQFDVDNGADVYQTRIEYGFSPGLVTVFSSHRYVP